MIKLGNNNIGKIYLGSNTIGKAYLGNALVYQAGSPTPPTPPQPQPILPAGYTELAYVSTNSNAYIDTGVAGATDLEITTKFYVGSYVQYAAIYGNYIDSAYNFHRAILNSETALAVAGGLNQSQSVSGFSLSSVHTLVVNSTTAVLDGNSTSITAASKTANTKNICLGNRNTDNPVERNIGLRIYSFEIKKDGTTVLNLIPAMRDSDDAVGFYDLVSDSFVKSLTGTEFTAGPANNYAPVEYIETDGMAYIDTGINGDDPRSCELKYMLKTIQGQCVLGVGSGAENTNLYYLIYVNSNGYPGFGHRYFYTNANATVSAESPFEAKCAMKNGSQSMGVKRAGDSDFQTLSKTQSNTITTGKTMYLFAAHNPSGDGPHQACPSGSCLYYCKIYSDNTYGGLVFDGVPCYYNGEYGLWDKVSGTFKGNAAASGSFSGPSNS